MAGKVYLAGAGPGDPELMSVKVRNLLGIADTVMHDALIGEEITDMLPDICPGELINCAKRKGDHSYTQEEINDMLVQEASSGKMVVRLKGGDPFVFGRGGEEMSFLRSRGIEVEVVSGITSAIAAPAAAGIPLTQRKVASQVTLVTGHEDPTKEGSDVNWRDLANINGTLVILMGITKLGAIAEVLMESGRSSSTPAATIEKATLREQKIVRGQLKDIASRVEKAGIRPPGTTIIGEVVNAISEFASEGK